MRLLLPVARRIDAFWSERAAVWRWGAVLLEMGMIWWLSSRRLAGLGAGGLGSLLMNSAHGVVYAVMAVLACVAFAGRNVPDRRQLAGALAIAVGYGIVDELHQSWVPGRMCSFADLLTDTAGACLGLCLLIGLRTGRGRWGRWALTALAATAASATLATLTTL